MKNLFLLSLSLFTLQLSAQNSSLEAVYTILEQKCASCHNNSSPAAGLDLQGSSASLSGRAIQIRQNLLNKTPNNAYAAAKGDKLVMAGRTDRSFLFRKMNDNFDSYYDALHTDEGAVMPSNPSIPAVTDKEKEIIRQWIEYGAKSGGHQFSIAVIEEFYDIGGEKAFPDGPPPAPAPGEGFQVKMGPFYLDKGKEVEYYQKYALDLPGDVEVDRLDMQFPGYSHHFLLYNFGSQAGANQVSDGLRLNANHSDVGLTAAVQEQKDLRLPETTAFFWDKNEILDLNAHYINYSQTKVYQAEVYMNVYTQAPGSADQEMHADLLVNFNIPIPNNGNSITHTDTENQWGAGDIHVWGMAGHTHKYGTGYKVWERTSTGQKGDLIYDASCPEGIPGCPAPNFDYQHIPTLYWEPLKTINWSTGIIHEAKWENDGPFSVGFGPTSDDEMMVLILFYTDNPLTVDSEEPLLAESQVAVYPNPSSEMLYFSRKNGAQIQQIRLFDAYGRVVKQVQNINASTHQFEISDLPKGVYIYQVDGMRGEKVIIE